jgi:hypothetical protein
MGAYLATRETVFDQFRSPRRARPTGLVCVHTAESVLDAVGPDTGAENVAEWMTRRTGYGSYHDLADSDSVIHLVAYGDEAFHDGTGSNPWSLSISFALRASDWPKLSAEKRRAFLRQGAIAFARQQAWLKAHGYPLTPLRRVTRAQSDAGQPGFISHAERDPSRRTDPGVFFPWDEFFTACRAALAGATPSEEDDTMRYLAYRNAADGQVALAAPGQWYVIPSPAYHALLKARGTFVEQHDVPPNEYAYLRDHVFLAANDALVRRAIVIAKADGLIGKPGTPPTVDVTALANALVAAGLDVGASPQEIAVAVADELHARTAG